MSLHSFLGKWKSTEQIERLLDYGLDFSKWIGRGVMDGYFLFSVYYKEEVLTAQVDIPISENSYFSIYRGRFQHTKTHIKIWQNEQEPVRIKYSLEDDLLTLKLFSKTIIFKKNDT